MPNLSKKLADFNLASKALMWFSVSTIITWLFINASPAYISLQQKKLSFAIAGTKWGLQIVVVYVLLGSKRWAFIERIGFTCLLGSLILLPYYFSSIFFSINSNFLFITSLIVAVSTMIYFYHKSVKDIPVHIAWWYAWLGSLIIAIILQLTIVFNVL